jgi:hypothetical protein
VNKLRIKNALRKKNLILFLAISMIVPILLTTFVLGAYQDVCPTQVYGDGTSSNGEDSCVYYDGDGEHWRVNTEGGKEVYFDFPEESGYIEVHVEGSVAWPGSWVVWVKYDGEPLEELDGYWGAGDSEADFELNENKDVEYIKLRCRWSALGWTYIDQLILRQNI